VFGYDVAFHKFRTAEHFGTKEKKNTTEFYFLFDFNKALCCLVVFLIFHCKVQNTSREGVKI